MRALSFLLTLMACGPAVAQAPSAEAAFAQGLEQSGHGAWDAAERCFRRAYILTANPAALYNRAMALRELGRQDDARASLQRVLRSEDLSEDLRHASRVALADLESSAVTLRLVGLAPVEHSIRLDGEPVRDRGERPLVLRTDRGSHTVAVELDGHTARWWSGTLGSSEARDIAVDLRPNNPLPGRPPGLESEPLFWVLLGAGGTLAGAVILFTYAVILGNSGRAVIGDTALRF